jgi:hypothetical protein
MTDRMKVNFRLVPDMADRTAVAMLSEGSLDWLTTSQLLSLVNEGYSQTRWIDKDGPPTPEEAIGHGGWFYVRSKGADGRWYISMRHFDDSDCSWWAFNTNHDVRTLTPNNSFEQWLRLSHSALKT